MTTVVKWTVDALERAGKTITQVFATTVLAAGVVLNWTGLWHALDIGLLAGVVALLTSVASVTVSARLPAWAQVALRAALTFGQSALAYLAANTFINITGVPWVQVFQISLISAVTSVLTSWASWNVGKVKEHPSVAPVA